MASSTTMMIVIMMMAMGIGGVFLLGRKNTTELAVGPQGTVINPSTMGQYYEPKALDPAGPVFVSDGTIKNYVPITGGSRFDRGPHKFAFNALGTCQCDEDKCCYKSIYQPRRGGPETEKECRDIYYGDPVDACERAVAAFNDEVFYTRVPRSNLVKTAMNVRLANIFST